MTRAVLICPGRGTYNKAELGYIARHHGYENTLFQSIEKERNSQGFTPLVDLDGADHFSLKTFARGDVASPLIATCGLLDATTLKDIEVVAVTGNSMGWYTALGLGGAVAPLDAYRIVDGMGRIMQRHMIGGQLVYPHVGDDWLPDPDRKAELLALVAKIDAQDDIALSLSIDLGGMLVLAGDAAGLTTFEAAVPRLHDRYPIRLPGHAGFHAAMQWPASEDGFAAFTAEIFGQPKHPLIDGRGVVWWPFASDEGAMYKYTFGHQVTQPYDFSAAIRTAAREFAPDLFIVLGPGTTMGGTVAQALIEAGWNGLRSRADFMAMQEERARVVLMGREDQRNLVT